MSKNTVTPVLPREVVAFDYAALEPEVARMAGDAASRIRARQQIAVIDIGRDLVAVKERLAHGQFLAWLDAEFAMSDRTARNYMMAAIAFSSKSATVADLPPTAIYALAAKSTPEAYRNEVVKRLEQGGRFGAGEIERGAAAARQVEKKAQEAARRRAEREAMPEAKRKRLERFDREQAEAEQRRVEREALAIEAADLIAQGEGKAFDRLRRLLVDCDLYEVQRRLRSMEAFGSSAVRKVAK